MQVGTFQPGVLYFVRSDLPIPAGLELVGTVTSSIDEVLAWLPTISLEGSTQAPPATLALTRRLDAAGEPIGLTPLHQQLLLVGAMCEQHLALCM